MPKSKGMKTNGVGQIERLIAKSLTGIFLLTAAGMVTAKAAEAVAETNALTATDSILILRTLPAFPPGNESVIRKNPTALQPPTSVLDLMAVTPNLGVFQGPGGRTPEFSVRGLRDNNLGVGEPQVVMYLDDVPYDDVFSRGVPLYDVSRSKLFRGPQGTQFGASGSGGVLDIHTYNSDNVWQGKVSASYGSYNSTLEQFSAGGALLTNTLFLDLSGLYFYRDGFVKDTVSDRYADTRETFAGRVKLRWVVTPRLDFTLAMSGHKFNDGLQPGVPLGTPNLYQVSRTFDGYDNQDGNMESLVGKYAGEKVNVTTITAHTGWYEALYQDVDFQPADLLRTSLSRNQNQWSQEIRAESADEDGAWFWRAGAFFAHQDFGSAVGTRITSFAVTQGTDQINRGGNYALFAQLQRKLTEQWELSGGLRYELDHRHSTGQQINPLLGPPVNSSGMANFFSWQPNAALTWKPEKNTRVWASVARSFMPGGYSFSGAPGPTSYSAANSWHYELGAEQQLMTDKLSLRATAFYTAIDNYQDFQPTGFGSFTMLNATRAHTAGGEVELLASLTHDVVLNLGGGFVSAKFDDFISPTSGANYAGKTINFVPNYTVNTSLTWRPGDHFFFQAGGQIVGSFWYDEANSAKQEMYGLLNLRAGWQEKHWSVTVFAQNALDTSYVANAVHFNQPPAGSYFAVTPGEPAVFGVEASVRF